MWCFRFDEDQRNTIARLIKGSRQWAKKNQCAVGVAEIALGVGILNYGITHDLVNLGSHIVGTAFDASVKTGLISSGIAGMAGTFLGNIGVAALGGAIAIPSAVLVGGAAVIFGCAGYGVAEMIRKFTPLMSQSTSITMGLTGASLVAVALIVDGARRILGSNIFQTIKSAVSSFMRGVLRLVKIACKVVFKSIQDFRSAVSDREKKDSAATTSGSAAAITLLVSLVLSDSASWPLLTLLTMLSPFLAFLFKELYFRIDATDSEQFLHDFGI